MYYIAGIVSLVLAMALQLSIGEFLHIASFKPTFVLIPLVFFSIGMQPIFLPSWVLNQNTGKMDQVRFKNGWAGWYFPRRMPVENAFRGAILGLVAGYIEGVSSRFLPGCIFSWVVTGSICGFISVPVNKDSRIVRAVLLFVASVVQGTLFYVSLVVSAVNYTPDMVIYNIILSALYNAAIGVPLIALIEKKRKEGVIREL